VSETTSAEAYMITSSARTNTSSYVKRDKILIAFSTPFQTPTSASV